MLVMWDWVMQAVSMINTDRTIHMTHISLPTINLPPPQFFAKATTRTDQNIIYMR
jgi:hypothetical protein